MGERARIPLPEHDVELIVVLDHPSNHGNIGAIARSLLNFGLDRLRIIGPRIDWSTEARGRAKHAQRLLDEATFHGDWDSCMHDIGLIVGTSGKREHGSKVQFRHFLLPAELTQRLTSVNGRVAVVFGEEGVGLTQGQLRSCDLMLTIPTWEGYPILNLSHAVSIVAYEWFNGLVAAGRIGSEESLPETVHPKRRLDPELRRVMRESVARMAASMPYHEPRRLGIEDTVSRVLMRSVPDEFEAYRLIGFLQDAASALEHMAADDGAWQSLRDRRSAERTAAGPDGVQPS